MRSIGIAVLLCSVARGESTFDLSVYSLPINRPEVILNVNLTTTQRKVSAIGIRIVWDPQKVRYKEWVPNNLHGEWTIIHDVADAAGGTLDLVAASTDSTNKFLWEPTGSPTDLPLISLRFDSLEVVPFCDGSFFHLNTDPHPDLAAFPEPNYIIYTDPTVGLEVAIERSVPADQLFIRGNVDRSNATVDVTDIVALINILFRDAVPGYDCVAVLDVNDDGRENIIDVVALVQGLFGSYQIPAPFPDEGNPGGTAQCKEGQRCVLNVG